MTYLKKTWISKETTISPEEFNRIEGNIQHSLDFTNITNKPANIKGETGLMGDKGVTGPIGPEGAPGANGLPGNSSFFIVNPEGVLELEQYMYSYGMLVKMNQKLPDVTDISQIPKNILVEKLLEKVPNSKIVLDKNNKMSYIELTMTTKDRIDLLTNSTYNFSKQKDYILNIGALVHEFVRFSPQHTEDSKWYTINIGVEYMDGTIIMGNNIRYRYNMIETGSYDQRLMPLYLRTGCPQGKTDYEIKAIFIVGENPYKLNRPRGVYSQYDPVNEGNSPTPIKITLPSTRLIEVDRPNNNGGV